MYFVIFQNNGSICCLECNASYPQWWASACSCFLQKCTSELPEHLIVLLCPEHVSSHAKQILLFGSAMLGLNMYSRIFPWYFANVLCHLSSKFTLLFIYTSDSNVSSQTFHMTYFLWFCPPFLKTSLEYSGFLPNVHASSGLWFSCKPVSLVFLPKPLTSIF